MPNLPSFLQRLAIDWGVHPDSHKKLASERPVERLPLPQHLHVPLQQHVGAPAKPVVTVGQRVRKGELIARGEGKVSAPIHAPTSGHVIAIGEFTAPHASGLKTPVVSIEVDGADEWTDLNPCDDPFELAPEEIAARVAAAGIVGMGGATFPSAVKLELGKRKQVEYLVLNGGECEPYLSADDRLMRERATQVVDGARIILRAIGGREVLAGIEDNKPEAIAAMRAAARPYPDVKICPVPSRYPMGSDKQLIQTLTGKQVPAGGRAADAGVLVHNVGTAYAVHRALRFGEPLISRIVTVTGGAVSQPRNLEVPIGTLASELFDFCGGFNQDPARFVLGGPMMGNQVTRVDIPIIKGISGVLALTEEEIPNAQAAACIRCATCVTACPMGLMPLELAAHIRAGDLNGAVGHGVNDCLVCGCCAFACPAHLPLVHYLDHAKGELAARERANHKQETVKKLTAARNERLAREAREKAEAAAKRKAAKQAAAAAAAKQAEKLEPSA